MPTPRHSAYLLPSLLTLGNLLCGFFAAVLLANREFETPTLLASGLIMLAMLLDGFDGLVARRLGVSSVFGAHLDSLADVVSFGVAPALLVTRLSEPTGRLAWSAAAWLLCAAALRLARFNAAGGQDHGHESFQGLPCPAAGSLLAAAAVALATARAESPPDAQAWLLRASHVLMPSLAIGLGLLMVSNVPYSHPLTRLMERPRGFAPIVVGSLVGAALLALGGYAPLTICVLFVASPLFPAAARATPGLRAALNKH